MYSYLIGKLVEKQNSQVVIDNSGIGFELFISAETYHLLPETGEEIKLYTYFYVREDKQELYGFINRSEKELFEILIGVSSIGPSKAISILSQISPDKFIKATRSEDIRVLASIKGLGRKTAERLILDLKDKLLGISAQEQSSLIDDSRLNDALSGLLALGFKELTARDMLGSIKKEIESGDRAEDIIKKALRKNG